MNDLPNKQYVNKVDQVAILFEKTPESKRPQQPFPLSSHKINYKENFDADSTTPTADQEGALLACPTEKPATDSMLRTGKEQSLVSCDVGAALQDIGPNDLTSETSTTSGSVGAAQVDKTIVSTKLGAATIDGDSPFDSDCRISYASPTAATTPIDDGPRIIEKAPVSIVYRRYRF